MREAVRSILFLAVMALIVGNGLAVIRHGLKERIENNRQMLRVRSLMEVMMGHDEKQEQSDEQLLQQYRQHVVELGGEPRARVRTPRHTTVHIEVEGDGIASVERMRVRDADVCCRASSATLPVHHPVAV